MTTLTPCETVVNPDLFFPNTPEELALARALCARCPVAAACVARAVELGVTDGVWGGQLFERGRVVAQKRHPGRPRKVVAA